MNRVLHSSCTAHSSPLSTYLPDPRPQSTTLMGRSQVQRNKTHGRPGQGRGGRGGPGRGDKISRKRQDLSKLGDNSYRFENTSAATDAIDEYDGLLDAIHLSSYVEPDNILDESYEQHDYLSIDLAGMAKCLEQLPIADRLKLPQHVGRHLEEMYGGVRKKTLAELREDALVQADVETNNDEVSGEPSKDAAEVSTSGDDKKDEDDLEAWLDDMIS